jgi:hypothetical protein
VDWHVKGLVGRLDKLTWVEITKVSDQPPSGVIIGVHKHIIVVDVLFSFIISN